jgi:D-beta-D-heptose 7-phosphate kinase/D-beta-D-heptose 1-phosphate adenosyltransferase
VIARIDRRRLETILASFSGVRLLVVGDVVLDEYLWGDVDRVSPEAPVPVVHVSRESTVLGGAGNVARNVIALGGGCIFCAAVGDDTAGEHVIELLKDLGVDPRGVVVVPGRPTTRKTRVVARSQQVVRFDRETQDPLSRSAVRELFHAVDAALPVADAAVLEDYGKGVLAPSLARSLMRRLRKAGLFVAADPKMELGPYRGASLLKPNLREAAELTGVRVRSAADVARAAARLRRTIGGGDVVVTRGADGMTLFSGDGPGVDVPTLGSEVFDVQGAGDTTIAALVLALRAGATLLEAAILANAAAGVVVRKIGTATATPDEVREVLPEAIEAASAGRKAEPGESRARGRA